MAGLLNMIASVGNLSAQLNLAISKSVMSNSLLHVSRNSNHLSVDMFFFGYVFLAVFNLSHYNTIQQVSAASFVLKSKL